MESTTARTSKRGWHLAPAVMALVIAALAGSVSTTPARADENDWNRGRQAQRPDVRQEQYQSRDQQERYQSRDEYGLHSYGAPAYVYAPPPVYYAPPPGPPVIDFVFPLRFR
jgi:hypothetical protein